MRADINGYVISRFDVYLGKNTMPRNSDLPSCFGFGETVVGWFMSSDPIRKYHQMHYDNYFSSIPLMEYLKTKQTSACVSICPSGKYLPANMSTEKILNCGDFD